jgi:uncharacterized protein YecT (DUF1311 family)
MLLLCGLAAANGTTPPDLQGRWQVVQVAADHRDQPHWMYQPDDPRLLGRELQITASRIELDDGSRTCTLPTLSPLTADRLQHFIGQQLPRPEHFGTAVQPNLRDFALELPDRAISPLRIACRPDNSPWNGAWLVQLSPDRLLTDFDNSGFVLLLQRRGNDEVPRASFDCSKAQSVVERAICASPTLTGYDRSVAAAYRRALRLADDDKGAIRQAQLDWLKTRNACGADAGCLTQQLRERVDQLMQ